MPHGPKGTCADGKTIFRRYCVAIIGVAVRRGENEREMPCYCLLVALKRGRLAMTR